MQLLDFGRLLFLHSGPFLPGPLSLAAFGPICGTSRAVKSVALGRDKKPPTLPATPLTDRRGWGQGGAQASVQRQDCRPKPLADQRICDTLRADTFLAVVQKQTAPAVIVTTAMYQSAGGAVLLVVHVNDHGSFSPAGNLM